MPWLASSSLIRVFVNEKSSALQISNIRNGTSPRFYRLHPLYARANRAITEGISEVPDPGRAPFACFTRPTLEPVKPIGGIVPRIIPGDLMNKYKKMMKDFGVRYRFLRKDPRTGIHLATISFRTGDGARAQIEVPASTLSNRVELRRLLQDRDAKLPTDKDRTNALLSAIGHTEPKRRQVYAGAAGWSADNSWFVTGRKVIGNAPAGQLATRPNANSAAEPAQLQRRGTAKQWRASVGSLSLGSSVLMLAICATFAAPLLVFTGRTSFAICFFGKTREGKTVVSFCAASMTGVCSPDDLISWRSTDTAIEERLSEFVDTAFVLDDITAMDAAERDQYMRLRSFAYMLATNQGKARARSYKAVAGVDHGRHRTILLTSAEMSIAVLAAAAKRQRFGGEELRLIDLPIADADQDHIFDRTSDTVRKADTDKWRTKVYGDVMKACESYHGAVFQTYISRLIPRRHSLSDNVKALVSHFVGHLGDAAAGPQARDLAEKFGLLYAGGAIGIELKCVPWTDKDLLAAVTTCYHRARNLLTDDRQLIKSGLKRLHSGLRQLPLHAPKRKPAVNFGGVDGYQERRGSLTCFVIKIDAFNRIIPDDRQRKLVQRALFEHHAIATARARSDTPSLEIRPANQFTWPDGERRRSLKITWRLPPMAAAET
jgi:putative DNA primase/helicase